MTFEGPSRSDFSNIAALNREFLRLLRAHPASFGFDEAQAKRLQSLGRRQVGWLAGVPFLLFSLYEYDTDRWTRIFSDDPSADLFIDGSRERGGDHDLAAAAAGFLWQLSRQNPHVVRMVCGATAEWCEQLGEHNYLGLLTRVRGQRAPIRARDVPGDDLWSRLLDAGVSTETEIRRAAQIAALQAFLTAQPETAAISWRTAACARRVPQLGVAEAPDDD